jgi:hypothetical protein
LRSPVALETFQANQAKARYRATNTCRTDIASLYWGVKVPKFQRTDVVTDPHFS